MPRRCGGMCVDVAAVDGDGAGVGSGRGRRWRAAASTCPSRWARAARSADRTARRSRRCPAPRSRRSACWRPRTHDLRSGHDHRVSCRPTCSRVRAARRRGSPERSGTITGDGHQQRGRRRRRRTPRRGCSWSATNSVRVCDVPGRFDDTMITAPNSPSVRAIGQHDAVRQAPPDRRQGDPARTSATSCDPSVAAASSWSVPDLVQHRFDLADHERHRDEDAGQHDAGKPKMILNPRSFSTKPERARRTPQQDQRDADHHRRHRERQVDDRLQQRSCRGTCCAPTPVRVGTPKSTLSGTTIATTSSDSCSAETAAGVVIDSKNAPTPGWKVRHRINADGNDDAAITT